MSEILKIAIPSIIALLGTLVVVLIGYRQWKHQQRDFRGDTFNKERQLVYKDLWATLEDIHLKLRIENVDKQSFQKLVLATNCFIMKNSLYLDKQDSQLSRQYLDAIYEMKVLLLNSEDEQVVRDFQLSESLREIVVDDAKELRVLVRNVNEIRDALVIRFRTIIMGETAPPD